MKNDKILIKICGIKDAAMAKEAALSGANFIGMIFHPASKRHLTINEAQKIVESLKGTSTLPVCVFVDQSAEEMRHICENLGVTYVQLHGEIAKQEHHLLPQEYRRIYVQNVEATGQILADEAHGMQYCDAKRDFLLFDNIQAGSGKPFMWKNFHPPTDFNWFLSGGLTAANVVLAIEHLHPTGVDVSSGIETQGKKDLSLIKEFIRNVNLR